MSGMEGRIRLYEADIRPLYEKNTGQKVYAYVDEDRRRKADACKQPQGRAASLAAGFLARYALVQNGYGKYCIYYGEKGQPLLRKEGTADGQGPWISLSHSGDYAVCALSDLPVGVDIQKLEPVRIGMLRHFFAEEERMQFVRRFGLEGLWESWCSCRMNTDHIAERAKGEKAPFLPKEAAREFLRLWTVKESYMKLTGAGMGLGFPGLSVDLERGMVWEKNGVPSPCRIWEYRAPEGYFLTACAARRPEDGER